MRKVASSVAFIAAFALYALSRSVVSAGGGATPQAAAQNSAGVTISDSTGPHSQPVATTETNVTQSPAQASAQQAPAPAAPAAPAPSPAPATTQKQGKYKDGTYTGPSVYVYYGYVQVKATVKNGALADVQFLSHPGGRGYSIRVNSYAMPILRQEALQAQSANVNTVSGASETSGGFRQSLAGALSQAA